MPVYQDSPSSLRTQFYGFDGTSVVSVRADNNGRIVITNDAGQTVDVSSTDLDIRDLTNASDSILIYGNDGTSNIVLKTDAAGNLSIVNGDGETLAVSATDLDIRDLTNASDSVLIYGNDGTSNIMLKTDAAGNLSIVNGDGETLAVSATDLDIRDLTNASDSVLIYGNDGTSNIMLKTDAAGNLSIVNGDGETLAVSATDLDIRDLTNASDSILIYGNDGTNNVVLKTDTSGVLETASSHIFVDEDLGTVTSGDTYQYVAGQDISNLASYAFFVNNTGANDATLQVQLSPDNTTWVNDGEEVSLAQGVATIANANKFLRYIRIGYMSASIGQSTDLDIIFQGQS
ncbi:MAG: DUF6385 domain-containing protein [Eubacteriales bacterium]